MSNIEITCMYYDGDDDCMKCVKHGILLHGCYTDCEDYTDHLRKKDDGKEE